MTSHFDLAIVGTGSGNSLVTPDFADQRIAVIEGGTFGGTCLNVGCIPTKMYVYAAEVANTVRDSSRYGIDATLDRVRWPDIRDRIFGRIDPIAEAGRQYRQDGPNTTAFLGWAEFTGPRQLSVSTGEQLSADRIVLATGSRPSVPEQIRACGVPYYTSDDIMRIEALPEQLIIVGGGYIAAEFAHVFSAFGVAVTVVNRSGRLLRNIDSELSDRFTQLAAEKWQLRLGVEVRRYAERAGRIELELTDGSTVSGDCLLVATGRTPNSDRINAAAGGVEVLADGRIKVDCYGRTTAEGVWSLGDASSPYQLKHVANAEARCVAHNLAHPDRLHAFNERQVPAAIFTNPQIASIGAHEDELRAGGVPYRAVTQQYGDTAYGWAMEDTTGICKLIADPATGRLLGAHLMGYQASSLIQPLVQAMAFDQSVADVARQQYWIHPALMEVVENALLKFQFDEQDAVFAPGES